MGAGVGMFSLDRVPLNHGTVVAVVPLLAVAALAATLLRRGRRWWFVTLPAIVTVTGAAVGVGAWYVRRHSPVRPPGRAPGADRWCRPRRQRTDHAIVVTAAGRRPGSRRLRATERGRRRPGHGNGRAGADRGSTPPALGPSAADRHRRRFRP